MKRFLFACCMLGLCGNSVYAEPLLLEQADVVLKPKVLEAGIADLSYQSDTTKITNSAGATAYEMDVEATNIPLYLRYALNSCWEAVFNAPYRIQTTETKVNNSTTKTDESGFADPVIGIKYAISPGDYKVGLMLKSDIPVGDSDFQEGFDVEPLIACGRNFSWGAVNSILSYKATQEYEDSANIKRDTGDIFSAGAGIELALPKIEGLSVLGEYIYQSFDKSKTAGVTVAKTDGSRSNLAVGVRFNKNSFKTKLGVDISVGDETYREYDYKVLTAISYLFNL